MSFARNKRLPGETYETLVETRGKVDAKLGKMGRNEGRKKGDEL